MSEVRIVTGSGHGLPQSIIEEYDIRIAPFGLTVGDEHYRDGIDITPGEFLKRINGTKLHPKTSGLLLGELINIYQQLKKEGKAIVSIHMSSGLSIATHNAVRKAKETVGDDIEIVDTLQTAMGKELIVLEAAKLAKEGKTKLEVLNYAKEMSARTNSIFALPDIMYLYRGGRIGKAKSLMGSLIKIIPIVALKDGEGVVSAIGKGRNISQVNEKIVEVIKSDLEKAKAKKIKCMVGHVNNEEAACQLKKAIEEHFECEEILVTEMGCVAIVHVGPKAWGVGYYMVN